MESGIILSSKQSEYIKNANKRLNFKIGAVRSGKSYVDVCYTVPKRLSDVRGKDGINLILGVSQSTIERNVLQPMREIYTDKLVGTIKGANVAMVCGEKVYCLGAEKINQIGKIQGMSVKYCYGDEVAKWNKEVFMMMLSRLDKEYSRFDAACNPEGPTHWLKEFLDRPNLDSYQQHYTIFDNPFLPESFVKNLCDEYKGTVYYDRYINGKWALAEGLIYPMYEKAIEDPPTEDGKGEKIEPSEYCLALDYGTENPFSAHIYGKMQDSWYVIDEYYYNGREVGRTKTDSEYADDLEVFTALYREKINRKLETIIDPSAASFKTELRRRGLYRVRDANNAVADGIRETATCLQTGKVKISPVCKKMIGEFGSYIWGENDKPIKENDHAMDELRYFCKTKGIARRKTRDVNLSGFEFA